MQGKTTKSAIPIFKHEFCSVINAIFSIRFLLNSGSRRLLFENAVGSYFLLNVLFTLFVVFF